MERIDWQELPASLDDVVHLVNGGKLRVVVERRGVPVGAFVSISDLLLLEHVAGDPKRAPASHQLAELRRAWKGAEPATLFAARSIVIEGGDDQVAMIAVQDLRLLEGIDEQIDFEAARQALEERLASGGD